MTTLRLPWFLSFTPQDLKLGAWLNGALGWWIPRFVDFQTPSRHPKAWGKPRVTRSLVGLEKDVGKMVISLDLENSFYPLVVCYIAIGNGPFVVDLPIQDCDFPSLFVCLPEANCPVVQVVLYRHPTTFFIKNNVFFSGTWRKPICLKIGYPIPSTV